MDLTTQPIIRAHAISSQCSIFNIKQGQAGGCDVFYTVVYRKHHPRASPYYVCICILHQCLELWIHINNSELLKRTAYCALTSWLACYLVKVTLWIELF